MWHYNIIFLKANQLYYIERYRRATYISQQMFINNIVIIRNYNQNIIYITYNYYDAVKLCTETSINV